LPDTAAFAVKALLTIFVVVAITRIVEALGPRAGGLAIGLPIVIGPGYLFLLREHPPGFVAAAAETSTAGLVGILAYLIAAAPLARRYGATAMVAGGTLAWAAVGGTFAASGAGMAASLAGFALLFAGAAAWAERAASGPPAGGARLALSMLLWRAVPAGLLVAGIGAVAARLGGPVSGFLISFPVAISATGVVLHRARGGDTAAAMLIAARTGLLGLAAFLAVLALALPVLGAAGAFALALAASLAPGIAVTFGRRGGGRLGLTRP
jgi:hypothetical protein